MTLTCPRCAQGIVVHVTPNQYEARVTCPRCGERIVIEVGVPRGVVTVPGVGPLEFKEPRC